MPTASKAFQAFIHIAKANPVILKLPEDSNTKLRIPNLHDIFIVSVGLDFLIYMEVLRYVKVWFLFIHLMHYDLSILRK